MPILENPRQEKFCQLRARGVTQGKAYELAGFVGNASSASQLGKKDKIKARIEEIRMEAQGRMRGIEAAKELALRATQDAMTLDAEWVKRELMQNVTAARDAGDFKNANEAVRLGAQIIGIIKPGKDDNFLPLEKGGNDPSAVGDTEPRNQITIESFTQIVGGLGDPARQLDSASPASTESVVDADFESVSGDDA